MNEAPALQSTAMPSYFPILLGAHIILAVSLVLPSILLPFALRARRATVESGSRVVQGLLWAQIARHVAIGVGLALTGSAWSRRSGRRCSSSRGCCWPSRSTSSTSAIAFFIQRPNLRRLVGIRAAADDRTWLERAQAAALRVVSDGRPGRDDRVPDELEAGAVVSDAGPVETSSPADCLFCRIVAGEIPADRLHEDDLVVAIRDIAPRAPTHILLMPRRHIASAAELTDADGPMLGRLFAVAADLARAEGIADGGYRLVSNVGRWGGQTVDHLHVHLMGGRRVRMAARVSRPGASARSVWLPRRSQSRSWRPAAPHRTIPSAVPPPPSVGPGMTVTPAVDQTRGEIVAGARRARTSSWPTARPRSGRPRRLCSAPHLAPSTRSCCPKDPGKGFIVVYEFADPDRAAAAAAEQQAYLATGPGRVQRPQGTVDAHPRRSARRSSSTSGCRPPRWIHRRPAIQTALETLGIGLPESAN